MAVLRGAAIVLLVLLAVTLQTTAFSAIAIDGVVPDVALLVVIGAALARGAEYGALVGFCAGLALDLAPPADHTAGRWALAFVVVGYLAGLVRQDARHSAVAAIVIVAVGSFVSSSLFALSGLVLADPGLTVDGALHVVPLALLYDLLLAPFVVPGVVALLHRLEPVRERI